MIRLIAKGLLPALVLGGCGTPAPQASANDMAAVEPPAANLAVEASPAAVPEPAASASASAQTQPTIDSTYQGGASILREILVADGKLDGAAITDFRLDDRCTTTIVTAKGPTQVAWADVTNIVSRSKDGRRDIRIERAGQPVEVSVADKGDTPTGNPALQLESGFGHLANECQS